MIDHRHTILGAFVHDYGCMVMEKEISNISIGGPITPRPSQTIQLHFHFPPERIAIIVLPKMKIEMGDSFEDIRHMLELVL